MGVRLDLSMMSEADGMNADVLHAAFNSGIAAAQTFTSFPLRYPDATGDEIDMATRLWAIGLAGELVASMPVELASSLLRTALTVAENAGQVIHGPPPGEGAGHARH